MRAIKVIAFIVLSVLSFSLYYYFKSNNENNNVIANNTNTITTAVGEAYKTPLGDRDTTVETNKQVILQLNQIANKLKKIEEQTTTNSQKIINIQNNKQSQTPNLPINANQDKSIVETVKERIRSIPALKNNKEEEYPINQYGGNNKIVYAWHNTILSAEKANKNTNTTATNTNVIDDVKITKIPRYTIPSNSVLSGVLTTALLGRIPINEEITEPYRFSVQITDKSLFANHKSNNDLKGMVLSGTAKGDLLLSCVRAVVDSITFIFIDGTINENKGTDIAEVIDEYGYPCIKGKLITNAPKHLSISTSLSAISAAAQAFAQAEQTVATDGSGNTTENLTGDAPKFATYNALTGGTSNVQRWLNDRIKSSFDVIFVASGQKVKLSILSAINIDYDTNGRRLNHVAHTNINLNITNELD